MADTRVIANKHRNIYLATEASAPFAQSPFEGSVIVGDFADFLDISSVVKWDGSDLGVQDSDDVDDRVLTDSATATIRSSTQFGGNLSLVMPDDFNDTTDIAQQAWELLRTKNTKLWVIERLVTPVSTAPAAGQDVNVYLVIRDSKAYEKPDDASWGYTIGLLPQGRAYIKRVIAPDTPVALTQTGFDTTMTVGQVSWGQVFASGNNITTLATYSVNDPTLGTVTNNGIVHALAAGALTVTAAYPGYTSVAVSITVA